MKAVGAGAVLGSGSGASNAWAGSRTAELSARKRFTRVPSRTPPT